MLIRVLVVVFVLMFLLFMLRWVAWLWFVWLVHWLGRVAWLRFVWLVLVSAPVNVRIFVLSDESCVCLFMSRISQRALRMEETPCVAHFICHRM